MNELPPRRKSQPYRWLSAAFFSLSMLATATVATAQNAGVIEFDQASHAVNEQAAYHTVKVKRTGGSEGAVSVSFATSDGTAIASIDTVANDYTATSGTLEFKTGETEKAITLQIVAPTSETVPEANETFQLTLANPTGGAALGMAATATITLNDTPLFFAPADQTTTVGIATGPIEFTISDAETATENLIVTATSNNPIVLPDSGIVLGGSGANRTVTLTPAAGQTGTAQVTLFVTDAGGATMARPFYLRVGHASAGTALAITETTPANSVPDVVIVADDSFTLNYTTASASWVTSVTFVELDNLNLINQHGTGSTHDLRTQPNSGGTARSLRIRGNDYSTSAGAYGRANVTLGFTGTGAPTNTHAFNVRVNPRAVVDNQLLAIPGTTSTFDVLANDVIPLAGHNFTITSVSTPANGTLMITPDGKFLRYTPTQSAALYDSFTYTVTVSSSDAFNGYTFAGLGSVRIGGYVVVDSAVSAQHTDIDIDYANGRWTQNIRTDAFIFGAVQSGASAQTVLDSDEGVLFLDPTTKMARPNNVLFDVLGVPAGAEVWRGPESSSPHKPFIGIANEGTNAASIESYTPVGDSRATSNSAWVRTDLVGFTGPGNFAAFYGGEVTFDTLDGLNSANDSAAGGNPSDTFWGFAGSHAHLAWYFTAPGRYTLTFRSTVKVGGQFVTSPDTTFTFDVDRMAGDARLIENPPLVRPDSITVAEDSGATNVDVLANDSSEADPYEMLSVTAVTQGTNGSVAIMGSGSAVSYSPALDFSGADSFTYTVTDEHGGSAVGTVNVTVTPVDDELTISAITGTGVDGSGNLIMNEDGDVTVNFTVSDAVTAGGSLTVTGTRTNTALFASIGTSSQSRLRLATMNGGERSLRVRPTANLSGTSSVTLSVANGNGDTASRTFDIVVNPVNDAPSFTKGSNLQHFNGQSGPQSMPGWASAINDGDPEVEQALTFNVNVVSGTSIFNASPSLSADGTLSYTLSGAPGLATVEVSLTDDDTAGGAARTSAVQTFTVGAYTSVEREVIARTHTDAISTFYEDGVFELATKADFPGQYGVRLDPALVWFHVGDASSVTLGTGLEFVAAPGSQVWIAPQTNPGNTQLWPGFSTEGVPLGNIENDQTTFTLVGVNGPGHLELYTSASGGDVTRLWSSDEDIKSFTVTGQTHMHANWAFTAAGKYEVTVEARVVIAGQARTAQATYTFFVGNTLPVAQATQIALQTSRSTTVVGEPVVLTASVAPAAAAGWVEFLRGDTLIGRRVLTNGAASFSADLPLGNHDVTARFVPLEVNYFSPVVSSVVPVSVSQEWGVPFGIRANKEVYEPGDIVELEVVGVTPKNGETFMWRIWPKNGGSYSTLPTGGTPYSSASFVSFKFEATQALNGVRIWVGLLPAGSVAPLTAIVQDDYYPVINGIGSSTGESIMLNGVQAEYHAGDTAQITVEHRSLTGGETSRWVRRIPQRVLGREQWTAITAADLQGTNPYTFSTVASPGFISHEYRYEILNTSGHVIGSSAAIQPLIRQRELTIANLVGVYRPGGLLQANVNLYPPLAGVTYQWGINLTPNPIAAETNQSLSTTVQATWNNRNIYAEAWLNGTRIARKEQPLIVVANPNNEHLLFTAPLGSHGDHYHSNDVVMLRAYPDPVAASTDTFQWFWILPGNTDWSPIPGATTAFYEGFRAEPGLHGTQIRVEHYDENRVMLASKDAGTIRLDDHGATVPYNLSVEGMQPSYTAGATVNLSLAISSFVTGGTVLPHRQWYAKLPGQTTPQAILGATGVTYSFAATGEWNGAEITAAVVRSDGQVIYGPSSAMTLNVSSTYTIVGLGTLGGNTSSALDVNNNRQVSGNSLVTADPGATGSLLRAYLWSAGTMTNLGSMAPIPPSTSTNRFGRGYAVNDAGVVVGEFNNDSSRAFVYSGGIMSGLIRLAGGTDNGVAVDINNANVIVGSSSNGTTSKATKWTYNGTTYVASDLGTIAGTPTATGQASAINENGAVAGQSTNSAGTTQATLWHGSNIINLTSLGDGTRFSSALGINESLAVVGSSSTGQTVGDLIGTGSSTGITRAFYWKDGVITELPPFNLYTTVNNGATTNYHSVANDINDAGVVVGNSQRISGSPAVATVWENGVAIDLNTLLPAGSGWVLTNAESINDRGDIAGTGTFGGVSRAFLLERRAENDMPSFVKGANMEHIGNNSGARSFPAWATAIQDGDVEVEQALTFNVQVTNGAAIFAVAPAVSANGTLSYTLSGVSGVATVEISLTDDATAGSAALTTAIQTFTVTSLSTTERQIISGVHADAIAIFGEAGALTLETMADINGEHEVRLDPDEVIFHVEEATRSTVPSAPEYAFLGTAGSSVWTAPQDNPGDGILWPGFSTEGVPLGMVTGDQISLRLESVSGPGAVHIYQTDAFNEPTRRLSSTGADYRTWILNAGQHVHANWAFSAAGTYALTFSATGTVNGALVTTLQTYTFMVGSMPTAVATTTTLTALPQLAVIGNPVQLTATVTPANALGYVEFLSGTQLLEQKALSQGSATITTTALQLGTNSIRARFVPVWEHEHSASTSGALSVVVTEPGGLPFGIVGVAPSYLAGDTLSAVLSGYTLKQDEQVRWRIRRVGSTSANGTTLVTAPSLIYNTVVGISHDGYEISAQVRLGSTVIATTDWVPLAVQQQGTAPVMTVANAPEPVYMGDTVLFHLQRGTLAEGETVQLVRRSTAGQWSEVATGLSTMPVVYPDADHVSIQFYMGTTTTSFDFAIRVMSNGVAVRQSAPITITLNAYEAAITGVRPLYRIGQSLTAAATVYPLREGVQDLTYAWEFRKGTQPNQVWGNGSGAPAPLTRELGLEHDGGNLFLFLQRSGSTVAAINMPIRVTSDLAAQAFFFESLAAHYHQGDNVNLRLLADPELSPGDQILWEWKWPGAEWTPFTLPVGAQYTTTAEQGLSGVQVRATLDFAEAGKESVIANPVTIAVDDHGAAARQKPTIAGATSYNASEQITLTRELPANGPTILTTHRWERKAAGDSSFSILEGQTDASLSFAAALADDGAEYRVSIMKPTGSIAYGPSAAVTLHVTPAVALKVMWLGQMVDVPLSLPSGSKATISGLPPGLKYDAKTNMITGRARTPGTYLISVQVKDAQGHVSTQLMPLVVKALPNDIVGKFVGYLSGQLAGSQQERSGGRLDLTVTALGSYSLKVTHGATTSSHSGYLDVTGEQPKLQVALRSGFDLTASLVNGVLMGSTSLNEVNIPVTGWRAAYNTKLNPAVEQQGYYTVALVQSSTATGHPQGHGFLAIKIGADGKTTATGKAADGSTITSTAFLGTNNKVLVHTPLYKKQGSVIGELDLNLDATGSYLENELEGTLTWSKPAITTGHNNLESDFSLPLTAYGRYMGAGTKSLILGLPAPSVLTQLRFESPALTGMSPDVADIELLYPSMKCLLPVTPGKTTLKLVKNTGAISGGFTLVDDRLKRVGKFQGMVVRDSSGSVHAVGYTLLPMLPEAGQSAAKTQIVSGAVEWLAE